MSALRSFDHLNRLFIVWAFLLQIVLIVHFALRKPLFESYTLKYGWVVYALGIPAAVISIVILRGGKSWSFWLGGFLFLIYAIFGFYIDYVAQIQFRNPSMLSVLIPYIILYLAAIMFYWWPIGLLSRPLWFVYAVLFVIATVLNITSH